MLGEGRGARSCEAIGDRVGPGTMRACPPKPKKALHRLGLVRDIDLALHLPLRYEDETRIVTLREARDGQLAQIEGTVTSSEITQRPRRQLLVTLAARAETDLAVRDRALALRPLPVARVAQLHDAGFVLVAQRQVQRQAGDFMSLCMNPEFACEVTLQPLDRYPELDAAILFSDILTIPDAMGQGLYFETGEGPRFKKVISTL
eukprot:gene19519-38902_t